MKRYFITATGTGVGKTLVTCVLAHQLRARALKPIISGFDATRLCESDTGLLLAAQGLPPSPQSVEAISPWRFVAPLSPDMAAEEEGREIDFKQLVAFCRQPGDGGDMLIEGVGGIMTPLTRSHTVLDWAQELGFPLILVAGSYLGTLSHTLVSARAIISAGLSLHAVVVSESESQPVALERTMGTLQRFLPQSVRLASISRLDYSAELWKYAPVITRFLAL